MGEGVSGLPDEKRADYFEIVWDFLFFVSCFVWGPWVFRFAVLVHFDVIWKCFFVICLMNLWSLAELVRNDAFPSEIILSEILKDPS